MKILAALILISPLALGQTVECVEVPEDHKIVFIPWFVPTNELAWKWKPAKTTWTDRLTSSSHGSS